MSSSLVKRSITGLILVMAMVSAIYSGEYYVSVLFWIVMNLGLHEWSVLTRKIAAGISLAGLYLWGNLLYLSLTLRSLTDLLNASWLASFPWICLSFLAICFSVSVFSKRGLVSLAMLLLGGFYVGGSFGLLAGMPSEFPVDGENLLMGFFILIWMGDVFAYVVGSLCGSHKLSPKLSPSKTWEGAIGGFIFTLLGGFFWWKWMLPRIALWEWLTLSVLVSVFGMIGDLFESKIKREAGVKDSGTLLPGHGGILDRFDSAMMAAPIVMAFLYFAA